MSNLTLGLGPKPVLVLGPIWPPDMITLQEKTILSPKNQIGPNRKWAYLTLFEIWLNFRLFFKRLIAAILLFG